MPHPYLSGTPRPRVLAHRGLVTPEAAARGVVENSRAAMQAAAEAGADHLESDCRLTRDGEVVLFHDAELVRVLGDERRVAEATRGELAELMADRGGLLTLGEALEAFPRARFNLDVKAAEAAEPMGRIVAPHAERVLLTSFSERFRIAALRAAEAAGGTAGRPATAPGRAALIRILLATAVGARRRTAGLLAGFDALQIPERQGAIRVLSRRLLEAAHRAGVEVHVWTVNDPERMRGLVRFGVDGVVTDRADLALDVLEALGSREP